VVLNSQPTADVVIPLSSSDTTEGIVSPSSLSFTPANWNVPQTVTLTGVDDNELDGDVAYQILTAPAVSHDPKYSGLDAQDVSVVNKDNDTRDLQVSGLTTVPATLQPGTTLVVQWNDANLGNQPTDAAWSDSVTIKNITTGEVLLSTLVPYDPNAAG